MTSIRNVNILRDPLGCSTTNNKNTGVSLITIALAVALALSVALSLCNLNAKTLAQEYGSYAIADQKKVFRVIVQVTNNADDDEVGTIHVFIDGTDMSKVLNGVVCPAGSTVDYTFEFDSDAVPVGSGFTAEMVYGDDVFKSTNGVNTPSKAPEVVQISIP